MAQAQKKKNDIASILGSLILGAVDPFVKTGDYTGGAVYEAARLLARPGSNFSISRNPFLNEEQLAKFSGKGRAKRGATEAAKTAAGVLSFAVPYGKGANIATKALLPGAASGGLYGFSQEDATPESVLGSAALGAGGAGAFSALGKVGGLLNKGGTYRSGVINPQVQAGARGYGKEQELIQKAKDLKLGGLTSQGKRVSSTKVYDKLQTQVDDLLKTSPTTVNKQQARQVLTSFVNQNGGYYVGNTAHQKILSTQLSLLEKKAAQGNYSAKALSDFKNAIGKKIKNFDNPGSEKQGIFKDIYYALDDLLTSVEPRVKPLTEAQSVLHQLAPGLAQQAGKKATLSPLGIPTPVNLSNVYQLLGSLVGGPTATAGGAMQKLSGVLPENIGRYTGAVATPRIANALSQPSKQGAQATPTQQAVTTIGQEQDQEPMLSPGRQWRWDEETQDWVSNQETKNGGITPQLIQQLAIADIMSTGGKNLTKIQALQSISEKTQPQMTAEQKNRIVALKPAKTAINSIRKLDVKGTGPQNRLEAIKIRQLGGLGADQKLVSLDQQFALLRQNVVRALQGARMSDIDIEIAGQYIPSIYDTPAKIKIQLDNLELFIESLEEQPGFEEPTTGTTNQVSGFQ